MEAVSVRVRMPTYLATYRRGMGARWTAAHQPRERAACHLLAKFRWMDGSFLRFFLFSFFFLGSKFVEPTIIIIIIITTILFVSLFVCLFWHCSRVTLFFLPLALRLLLSCLRCETCSCSPRRHDHHHHHHYRFKRLAGASENDPWSVMLHGKEE